MTKEAPLGKETQYTHRYAPELLFPIARAENRSAMGLTGLLPFRGQDIWNAWELTWLSKNGQPRVAIAEIRVPAESPNIVESKSLKLYLNSFSMSQFESAGDVAETIQTDLGNRLNSSIEVSLHDIDGTPPAGALPGQCIDDVSIECERFNVSPELLRADDEEIVSETLHSHLLRSLCPVTGQPDSGSVMIEYTGPRIDPVGLLRYIVSFREHQDFHEACVERMFLDIHAGCRAQELTIYARYQRRGGIDINPYRSTSDVRPTNPKLWRQ